VRTTSGGRGDNGHGVTLHSYEKVESEARFAENEFDVVISESVSLNRSLPDYRHSKCVTPCP